MLVLHHEGFLIPLRSTSDYEHLVVDTSPARFPYSRLRNRLLLLSWWWCWVISTELMLRWLNSVTS